MLCLRCSKADRMQWMGRVETDWGAFVTVWVCKRCGIMAFMLEGANRPEDGL